MSALIPANADHPVGEQPEVESWSATADTFADRVHVEWDSTGSVTPLGQLPFFINYLKQAGLFASWVADCPLVFSSPNAPSKMRFDRHHAAVGVGWPLSLRAYHHAAVRCGEPATAWHEESGQ